MPDPIVILLGVLLVLALGAAFVLARRGGGAGDGLGALSGKLDAMAASADRNAGAVAAVERAVADRLGDARAATDAALAAQRDRLSTTEQVLADRLADTARALAEALGTQGRQVAEGIAAQNDRLALSEKSLADRLSATTLALTDTLGGALAAQNERLALTEKALADRLAASQVALDAAVAGQNERLNRLLTDSAVKAEETAGKIHERLAVIDAARANMEALGAQVGSLAQILSNKQARGAFGEVQLRGLIEDRLPPDSFSWQHTLANGRRCDVLIRMPNAPVAIDSKFPLEAWMAARDAPDDAARLAATRRFATDIAKHVDDVATRYICPGETADHALIFVPSEAIYGDLHVVHPGVVEAATRRGVFIVSPTTMWALLGSIRALMQDVRMRAEAGKIKAAVIELMKDVNRLDERVTRLKKHFADMQGDVQQIEITTTKITRRGATIDQMELEDSPVLAAITTERLAVPAK